MSSHSSCLSKPALASKLPHSRKRSYCDARDPATSPRLPHYSHHRAISKLPLKHKKPRTPRVTGQPLPISRLIQVLDHSALQALFLHVLAAHPHIADTVVSAAPSPSLASAVALSKQKLHHLLTNLPYKCDPSSDYLYLRIKPLLSDFLHCLSDFILHFLPPSSADLPTAIAYLDEATSLIFKVPNFTNSEFQYTRTVAFEQIANTWLAALSQVSPASCDDSSVNAKWDLLKLVKENGLVRKLANYNELLGNRFSAVCDYLHSELASIEGNNCSAEANDLAGLLGDLITVDYSAYSIAAQSSN